ncbi:hypothetical protein HDF24_00290 [Mucilaginibacter sp. X4EP1]|uniref:hypothetical protein n=1 Tax=Mucilaginibacter sp. X4EP1 TaxID=2723092 RepID=UPI0021675F59|nr:hypothetical protein [Mucilaginibacter sp. X4EP1]MCS3811447.1 hypothetical protein [Mucilaginibacter sp. X4EP1]
MQRKILLIEPNYKNKYPPIGLMKISTYHKSIGDHVQFFKGNLKDLILERKLDVCIERMRKFPCDEHKDTAEHVLDYLKTKRLNSLAIVKGHFPEEFHCEIEPILKFCAYNFIPTDYWDRIYITTLFTFYWKITIKTIEFAKTLMTDSSRIYVGGVMASLLKKEIEIQTGIKPFDGLLDKPGILDVSNELIVDELVLDYSILDEIDYKYPTQSAYFTFMTKGCTRKCSFCSVPKLEPTYKSKIESIEKFKEVTETFGEQRNLLLMDNNVLASPKFPEIIQEIKEMGFYKGATFNEPNQLDITIKNLQSGHNDKAYTKRASLIIHKFFKKLRGPNKERLRLLLERFEVPLDKISSKNNLIEVYPHIDQLFEKYRSKKTVLRYVDFNQGTDARYVTDELMRLMSEIPIKPLRIAFDHIGIQKQYVQAVELAAKYGIKELSNYILFNYLDKPNDFYNRLRINIDLGKRLGINIFSFPMKYVPLFGEEAKDRKYIGSNWNRKFLRAVQSILNATKGIVAPGYDFFENAFGTDVDEFIEILYMPEQYIMNRKYCLNSGITEQWRSDFNALDSFELVIAKQIIHDNYFDNILITTNNIKIHRLLKHYTLAKLTIQETEIEVKKLKSSYNKLIRDDMFKNLTLTYDFDGS